MRMSVLWLVSAIVLLGTSKIGRADAARAAADLAIRLLADRAAEFQFVQIPPEEGLDILEFESANGKPVIRGSTGIAMASGLNWYLKYSCNAHVSWCGNQLNLPRPLPDAPKTRITTPYRYRYYFNYCSFSYTMAFWHWDRWQREIDWMALNGINAPLAVTGQEAVWQNMYRKMGLTDPEISRFIVGPGYLPFGWMGCIDGWGGPLPQSWIDTHLELGQKILVRQRELGMTPVLQGFTGHISPAINRVRPDLKLQRLPSWAGFEPTYFIDPTTPAFVEIGKAFVEEQTRLFGTDHLYASDTFIEMNPPSNEPAFLASMGKALYQSMATADPQAIWFMQGWIFVNSPDFWKPPQAKALLGAVPDDRMVLLDLFCDSNPSWNRTESFYGKPWVWCVLHSFGGVTGLYGNLATVANAPPTVLADPKHGKLTGIGMMMEAFGHNPVYYELMTEMTWRTRAVDASQWVRDYAARRYGKPNPKAQQAWDILRQTAYSHGLADSVITLRPRFPAVAGSPGYDPMELLNAWQLLADAAPDLAHADGYRYDLVDVARQVLANLSGPLCADLMTAYERKDATALEHASQRFIELIGDIDQLLATRQEFLLGAWLDDAKRWAQSDDERRLCEWNARNQITLWGPRDSVLRDYARKQWAGLLRGFHQKRWEMFLDRLQQTLASGKQFDAGAFEKDIRIWEEQWTHGADEYAPNASGESVAVAQKLLAKYRPIIEEAHKPEAVSLTTGKPVTCSHALPPHPAKLANDGRARDTNAYWATDVTVSPAAWWQVDLEKPTTVGRIVVVSFYGDQRSYGFTVEGSTDGTTWEMLANQRQNQQLSTAAGCTCVFQPRQVRYIRVMMTSNSANTGRHLVEVEAFEK